MPRCQNVFCIIMKEKRHFFVQEMNNGKRHKLVRQETVFISKLRRCQIIFATSESIL